MRIARFIAGAGLLGSILFDLLFGWSSFNSNTIGWIGASVGVGLALILIYLKKVD